MASTRMPYCSCRSSERRYESPRATEAVYWPYERSRTLSVRVKLAGMPASRSSSELKVKVPRRLFDGSVLLPLWRSWVVSLMRCLLASSNQLSVFSSESWREREEAQSDWFPPKVRFWTLLLPSAKAEEIGRASC